MNIQVRKLEKVSSGATTETVELDALPYDKLFCWTLLVARTNDSKARAIRIYVKIGASEYSLLHETVANEGDSVSVGGGIRLPGNARICADFMGLNSGKSIELYACGYEIIPITDG